MLKVQANDRQVAQYKRLLTSEWKSGFPEEILALLWSTLQTGLSSAEEPLFQLLDPGRNGSFPAAYFHFLVRRIEEASKFFVVKDLPAFPPEYHPPGRLSRIAWQAVRLATYLTLQGYTRLSGDAAFFRDLQALAFQAAIHFVLPMLSTKHPAEHAVLLHALALFPLEFYALDPGHFCSLISALHGYLGNGDERLRFLNASFRFTRPEDHAFLTRAQEFWSELLDSKRYEEAEKFLLSLGRWALPEQQEEVREMVVDAFQFILKEKASSH